MLYCFMTSGYPMSPESKTTKRACCSLVKLLSVDQNCCQRTDTTSIYAIGSQCWSRMSQGGVITVPFQGARPPPLGSKSTAGIFFPLKLNPQTTSLNWPHFPTVLRRSTSKMLTARLETADTRPHVKLNRITAPNGKEF